MEIYEVWNCIGMRMYQTSKMTTSKSEALLLAEEYYQEQVKREPELEVWLRTWKLYEIDSELVCIENKQLY